MSKTEKLQRNPMSLKEHIIEVYYGIKLKIGHASFNKFMTKQFNWIVVQDCQVEGCKNKAIGYSGTKEDGSKFLLCHKHWCEIVYNDD